ncbi:hypothetical protein B9Z55_011092 [Caenorhabditis nigoni]|uniref:Uncharacterized protein n=1 Tax=Caenorhabditis nigoni TaxID=1611254 RepID=A0A2G5UIQ5_9PELO|nr:hypothetical protein B9Z55_011092 [Caenorhabditis nigoni]
MINLDWNKFWNSSVARTKRDGIQSHRESQEGMHSVEQFQQTAENAQEYDQAAHRRIPTETEGNVNAQMQQNQKLQPNANAPHQLNMLPGNVGSIGSHRAHSYRPQTYW